MSFVNLKSKFVHEIAAKHLGCTELELINTVTEISTDGTLGDNSDTAIPTEKAVKTYVDNKDSADETYVSTSLPISYVGGPVTAALQYVYTDKKCTIEIAGQAVSGITGPSIFSFTLPTEIHPISPIDVPVIVSDTTGVRSMGLMIIGTSGAGNIYSDLDTTPFPGPNGGFLNICTSYIIGT